MTQAEFFDKLAALRKRHPLLPVVIKVDPDDVHPPDECKWQLFDPVRVEVKHLIDCRFTDAICAADDTGIICQKIFDDSDEANSDEYLPTYKFLKKYLRGCFEKSYRVIAVRVSPAY